MGYKMIRIKNSNFSAEQICESGQCFRMRKAGENKYTLIAHGKYLEILQEKVESNSISSFMCSQDDFDKIWYNYFDMATDYGSFIASVPSDDNYLLQTVRHGSGIRILNQDIWEILITFIISQQNNIKRIRKSVEMLCERWGEKKETEDGIVFHAFPDVESLAAASDEELRSCGLGYRSRYLSQTARMILHKDIDLRALRFMGYSQAKDELLKLCGVGNKVADCICLFALHQLEAFPIDTHINKVLALYYPGGFPFDIYEGYAGVMQQYIFYYDLMGVSER